VKLHEYSTQLAQMFEKCQMPDMFVSTGEKLTINGSAPVQCAEPCKKHNKKKTLRSSQSATERVQKLRCEYWDQVKEIDPANLVFLDETGVLLGLTRTHARSPRGSRVYDLKPFYRGAR